MAIVRPSIADIVADVFATVAADVEKRVAAEVEKRVVAEGGKEFDGLALDVGFRAAVLFLGDKVHAANARWWVDPVTRQPIQRNVGEMLMLTVSELAEGMEGHRKSKMDDHLPHRPMLEVELADAMIRILDMAAGLKLDLAGAFAEKMAYNAQRVDHTFAARAAAGGKKY